MRNKSTHSQSSRLSSFAESGQSNILKGSDAAEGERSPQQNVLLGRTHLHNRSRPPSSPTRRSHRFIRGLSCSDHLSRSNAPVAVSGDAKDSIFKRATTLALRGKMKRFFSYNVQADNKLMFLRSFRF
jgi:hypothetical protein